MTDSGRFDVVVVGSANLDLVATTHRLPGPGETVTGHGYFEAPGGKGANQAVAAARAGARVAFVGAVGDDHAGDLLRRVLADEGIDVSALLSLDVPTGRALIGVADDGENSIIVVPGANARVDAVHVRAAASIIGRATVVACQCEVSLDAVVEAFTLAAPGALCVLNPAPAPADLSDALTQLLDVLVPNEHEVVHLGGVPALLARGIGEVIVTEGSRGATRHLASGSEHVEPFAVAALDTTGAGDAFCGALAARLALGDPPGRALAAAAAAGALATTVAGAIPSLPRWADIERLVNAAD